MQINFIIFFIIFGLSFVFLCRKFDLIVDYKLEKHKRFSSKSKSNSIGGILLSSFFVYQFFIGTLNNLLFFLLAFILIIGFMSDIKKLNSVSLRFAAQVLLIIFFITFLDFRIYETKIDFVNQLLQNNFINIIFVTFCLMVLMNGSNFIDGLNGLLIKYFLIVYLVIFYKFSNLANVDSVFLVNLIIILSLLLFLNLFGFIYMGDSGAYMLSLFTGIYLIIFFNTNSSISPYLAILLLWYPCFELLFSMIRRSRQKLKAYKPDNYHLHQFIYKQIKKKMSSNSDLLAHFFTSFLINSYNLIIFIISLNYIYNSEILILILVINIALYLLIYSFFKKKYYLSKL